jgi:8-oxo-dGTP pyrophosphatase MutT (NUDIX family)
MPVMPMSPFVAGLRALVGHELLQLPTVAVLCRDEEERVLLVRQRDSGRWTVPGGAIEPDEEPATAAARETREETGLDVTVGRLRAAIGGPDCRTRYPNGDELSYVALVYEASVIGGVAAPDDEETTAVAWFALSELAALDKEGFLLLVLRENLLV